MDYSDVIREAWALTRRHRSLWVLGLFAGGSAGVSAGNGVGRGVPPTSGGGRPELPPMPGLDEAVAAATRWVQANAGLIAAAVAVLVIIGLVLILISLIAQGGLATATLELAQGRPMTLGAAWGAGLRLLGRFFRLGLLVAAVGIVVALVLAATFALGYGASALPAAGSVLGVAASLLAIPLTFAAVAAAVLLSIIVPYAHRSIAQSELGAIDGLKAGWALLRRRPWPSLIAWLLGVVIGIGVGLVLAVALLAALVVLGLVGLIFYLAAGFTTPTIAYAAVAVLIIVVALWLLSAVANTYFWHYWTLVYLRLSAASEPSPMPSPGPSA